MRIAYVSVATPYRKSSWSGTAWYTHREILRRFPDTHVIETPLADAIVDLLAPLEDIGLPIHRSALVTEHYGRAINRALERLKPDVVVAVAAAHKIAYIDAKWPVVYAADAMFATVAGYYERYASRTARYHIRGDTVQRALLEHVDHILLASDWAVGAARDVYGLPEARLSTVPMGANLDDDPGFLPPSTEGPITLLFVGYEWERKGGDLALEIWRELRDRTGDAILHVVGAKPAAARRLDGVHLHGRLDKGNPDQYRTLVDLYRQATFFMMPSRQEAFGIVYCEASAFGRPSVATRTGGVSAIISDGETGVLLPLDAEPRHYADRIEAAWSNQERYRAMCIAARRRYETTLNWQAWGAAVEKAVGDIARLSRTRSGAVAPTE